MSDPLGHVFRSLAVPEILQDANRFPAAAVRLHALATGEQLPPSSIGFDVKAQADLEDAELVVRLVADVLVAGALDPLLGGYGTRTTEQEADRLLDRIGDAHSAGGVQILVRALLHHLVGYVNAKPLEPLARPVPSKTTRRVAYEGDPAMAGVLVTFLEEEGVEVEWELPLDRRLGMVGPDSVGLLARGAAHDITAAAAKFRERFPGTKVTVGDEHKT